METHVANTIKQDFLEWSGGFPPGSEEQIFIYTELVGPIGSGEDYVRKMLREWMNEAHVEDGETDKTTCSDHPIIRVILIDPATVGNA